MFSYILSAERKKVNVSRPELDGIKEPKHGAGEEFLDHHFGFYHSKTLLGVTKTKH